MRQQLNKILLLLALLLAGHVASFAATYYGFRLGGVEVTSTNCNDIQKASGVICTKNTTDAYARYDHASKTLTLYNITFGKYNESHSGLVNESCSGLKVVFAGNCSFFSKDSGAELKANTTFMSQDGLFSSQVVGIHGNDGGMSVANGAMVDFTDAYIYVRGDSEDSGIWQDTGNKTGTEAISIWNSRVRIKGYRGIRNIPKLTVVASYVTIEGDNKAVENLTTYYTPGSYMKVSASTPENAYFDADRKTFYSATGNKAATMVTLDCFYPISTYFTDAAFRSFISDMSLGSDGKVTIEEALQVSTISVTDMGISSLKGLELFGGLTHLYCGKNQITELDLTPFNKLVFLECNCNRIEALDLSRCGKLQHVNIGNNRINEANMQQLVDGLPRPTSEAASFDVTATMLGKAGYEYDNACTYEQRMAIAQKGWKTVNYTEDYGLTVGGMVINTDNFNNMLDMSGVRSLSDAAVAYYEPTTNELHLGDVTVWNYQLDNCIALRQDKVKIVLEGGTVNLYTSSSNAELYCGRTDVEICGEGTLHTEPYNQPSIQYFKSLTVSEQASITINRRYDSYGACIEGYGLGNVHNMGVLTLKGDAFIKAGGTKGGALSMIGTLNLEDGCEIISPEGTTFNGENCTFVDGSGKTVTGKMLILGKKKQIKRVDLTDYTWPQARQHGDYEATSQTEGITFSSIIYQGQFSWDVWDMTTDYFEDDQFMVIYFEVVPELGYELASRAWLYVNGERVSNSRYYNQETNASRFFCDYTTPEYVVPTGIDEASSSENNDETLNKKDSWTTIDGQRLDRKPTQKGIYLHGGKKIVLK